MPRGKGTASRRPADTPPARYRRLSPASPTGHAISRRGVLSSMNQPLTPPSRRNFLATSAAAVGALTLVAPLAAQTKAQTPASQNLKKYNVTIRTFNPAQGPASGEQYILPVDSPDPEHAIASTLANAVSFTKKTDGSSVLPVAFICTGITERS